ncbi:extended synaptotagmin-2-like [Polyodon spathula]|uniref:extended synaptotagmin-2-like n=1 Tax=Polyodon spathula TaxID=7913 RepID=UPI001B7EB3AC|nr:extended synaptotagmin-2-like [Polyodon spathula]
MPMGIVRIFLIEAKELMRSDLCDESDAYTVIHLGEQTWRSTTIFNSQNPQWNEIFEAAVHEANGQILEIAIYDKDNVKKDDSLGRLCVELSEVYSEKCIDRWFQLSHAKTGSIHLMMQWFNLKTEAKQIEEMACLNDCIPNKMKGQLSSAFLLVYLTVIRNEKQKRKTTKDQDLYVEFNAGHKNICRVVSHDFTNPLWYEAFHFLITDPHTQEVAVKIKDKCGQQKTMYIPLRTFLDANDFTVTRTLHWGNIGPNNSVNMQFVFRTLAAGFDTNLPHLPSKEKFNSNGKESSGKNIPMAKLKSSKRKNTNQNATDNLVEEAD